MSHCVSAHHVQKCFSTQVVKCLECLSVQVLWVRKCPCKTLGVSKCLWSTLWVTKCPFSALQVKKIVCNITGNEILNSFIEFLKHFSEYVFYITLIVFCFLGNKMCKFYHVLLFRYKHSKGLQLQVYYCNYYSCSVRFYYCSCRVIEPSLIF